MERDQAVKFMHDLLRAMVSKKASDLFITAGFPPAIKLDGKMTPVANQPLTSQHTAELTRSIMNDKQAGEFEASHECNFAVNPRGTHSKQQCSCTKPSCDWSVAPRTPGRTANISSQLLQRRCGRSSSTTPEPRTPKSAAVEGND